jgi:hypothetical protein
MRIVCFLLLLAPIHMKSSSLSSLYTSTLHFPCLSSLSRSSLLLTSLGRRLGLGTEAAGATTAQGAALLRPLHRELPRTGSRRRRWWWAPAGRDQPLTTSVSSCYVGPPPRSTAVWVLLFYGNSTGPPPLRRRGCAVLIATAAGGYGRRDLEGAPSYTWLPPPTRDSGFGDGGRRPPSSTTAGGVFLPRIWQIAARSRAASGGVYERRIDNGRPGSGPHRLRSGLMIYLLLKINFWCRLM